MLRRYWFAWSDRPPPPLLQALLDGLWHGQRIYLYVRRQQTTRRPLRPALVQAAHAVSRTDTYLGEKFRRVAWRRGKKRAAVAVARTMLVIAYHIIRDGTRFEERGADYFDQLKPQSAQQWLTRRLERLGLKVTLEPIETVAA